MDPTCVPIFKEIWEGEDFFVDLVWNDPVVYYQNKFFCLSTGIVGDYSVYYMEYFLCSVHLTVNEKLVVTAGRDGGLQNMEVLGMMQLRVTDPQCGCILITIDNQDDRPIQFQVWVTMVDDIMSSLHTDPSKCWQEVVYQRERDWSKTSQSVISYQQWHRSVKMAVTNSGWSFTTTI